MNKLQVKLLITKTLVYALEFLAVAVFLYLVLSPFWPLWRYRWSMSQQSVTAFTDLGQVKQTVELLSATDSQQPSDKQGKQAVSPGLGNRLLIGKIGVDTPIIDSTSETYGLNHGAWRYPGSSTPDQGGNTVLTGHRFKYLPPNNLTFYLFDQLQSGDLIAVKWQGQDYYYRVRGSKIVEPTDLSVLAPSSQPILTMFTCDPIFSQDQRLVIIADLIVAE